MMFDDEPGQVDFDFLSESENLASDTISGYDCDSEGGGNWGDVESEDGDGEASGTSGPGMMGLKFQLDAARAGELHCFRMDPQFTELRTSPEFYQRG